MPEDEKQETFCEWCILELMGNRRLFGKLLRQRPDSQDAREPA